MYENRSNVGRIFQEGFARMEGKREETPPNTEQQGENIASVSSDHSDGQETSGRQSSTTPSSTPEGPEEPIKSTERAASGEYFNICLYDTTFCEH